MHPNLKAGKRVSLAITNYESEALEALARHRGQVVYTVATGPSQAYTSVSRPEKITGAVLLRRMSLREVIAEYERLKAEGKIAA